MEEKNNFPSSTPNKDRQLWEDILSGKETGDHPPLTPEENGQMWENIITGIRNKERKSKQRRLRIYGTMAATVILTIFGLITYNTLFKPEVYLAASNNSEIKLADGSVVILSQGGKLTVEKSFPSDTREVFLEGDAIFKVAKSKEHPFIVHGNSYETKVLGTIFKVSQSGKTFKVDLFEGKVLVFKTGHPTPIPLAPKQTFTNYGIPEASSVISTENAKTTRLSNKSASLTFQDCPLKEAFQVIEKTYGVTIHYPRQLDNIKITSSSIDSNAAVATHMLAFQLNLKFKQINDSIFELEE
ncbi:hypothetical protein ATE47_01320 [Chryseobacterium sp. IHB B 17019]|uniref:FecR family protein n=1 Tax=Chryseobacterium sp. IHB B 17019 TaxID=1721091 RepID=UPI00072189AE|nr:FecR family protein [Chryseobacterium sp. IHB B 17019]ALR29252.1 hypothetical protein ATE47_01320 [Chryseobacterium sp. IHB B 17019]